MNPVKVPPIKSQGIKTKLVPWIREALDWNGKGTWIEPFMGTGVVGFNIAPSQALFCDTNPHLIAFYQAVKKHSITPPIAKAYLEEEGKHMKEIGGEHYYHIRERFNNKNDPLDFLFLNRSCFNGMIRFNGKGKFNVPWGHKPNRFAQAYITKITNQIKWVQEFIDNSDWRFEVCSFETAIQKASANDFIYCDPPYIDRHTDYYNGWGEEQEKRLFAILRASSAKFLLSTWHSNRYRKNQYVADLWSEFHVLTKEHFYHVGASERNRNSVKEALIANYVAFVGKPHVAEFATVERPTSAAHVEAI